MALKLRRAIFAVAFLPLVLTAQVPPGSAPLVFVTMTPCRMVDTRAGSGYSGGFGPPSLVANATRTFAVRSSATCSIPAVALAYSFEITVAPPGPLAYVTAYPSGQSTPVAAIAVESPQGFLQSNTGIIPAGTNGSIDVYASNPTDIVIDINGYYASLDAGPGNTALGQNTLASNISGTANTAGGYAALQFNVTGSNNAASGYQALQFNTTGNNNTATGSVALNDNTIGFSNTAGGFQALYHNTTGFGNTAVGMSALYSNTAGNNNIAIGIGAAGTVLGGNSNIHIGSQGAPGDSATIRIGTPIGMQPPGGVPQTSFFVAGVSGVAPGLTGAVPVVIDSNGQLGTVNSSIRFKEDVGDMAEASSGLFRLRPVTYRYKQPYADGAKPIDYGLIAEEVAEVYPDLVARSADGQIQAVQYQKLTPMLLNEVQKQHQQMDRQTAMIQQQADAIRLLQSELASLKALVSENAR
jgi:hypothetical protein